LAPGASDEARQQYEFGRAGRVYRGGVRGVEAVVSIAGHISREMLSRYPKPSSIPNGMAS
jgi:hypothetical protein